jgi:hypothetical protein
MTYHVTYQIDGEERTDQIAALDAASAAESVRAAHDGSAERFELILVHLVEDEAPPPMPTEAVASPS